MFIRTMIFSACLLVMTAQAQVPAKSPVAFDKFFTNEMKMTGGIFPVYQKGKSFYLEIPAEYLNRDVLVMAYVSRGNASAIAKSTGIIRFSKGINDFINVTRPFFSEGASGDANGDMERSMQRSAMLPVNYGYRIEAYGKQQNSYIIEITRQLMESGDWFSFADKSYLSSPDPQRSFVQQVSPEKEGVRFLVERSQTDYLARSSVGPKSANYSSFEVELLISLLPVEKMTRKIAEGETGFETFSFIDYGKTAYTARKTSFIRKWDIRPGSKKHKGMVAPERKISVMIDEATPALYRNAVKNGILAWNKAFNAAGFQDVIEVGTGRNLQLAPGKVVVNWANAYMNVLAATVDNPETGEIITARINLTNGLLDEWMLKYLVQCGATDARITKDLKNKEIASAIIQWKVMRAMGEVLGLKDNLLGSTRYSPAQLRNAAFLRQNGISGSIMDELGFNYLAQPADRVPVEELIPRIGADDIAAIQWAYGTGAYPVNYCWQTTDKEDPLVRKADLSDDITEAATLGINNLKALYPLMGNISSLLDGTEELFNVNGTLYGALQKEFTKYVLEVTDQVGGVSVRKRNRIEVPAAQQKKALQFLADQVFNGPPSWMNVKLAPNGKVLDVEEWNMQLKDAVLNKIVSVQVLGNLAAAEEKSKDALTPSALFDFLDKEIFFSFDKNKNLTAAQRATQLSFVTNLSQAAFKNNISQGLGDGNMLLHYYMKRLAGKVNEMSREHTELLTRENYSLMKMKIEKEFFAKINK
ncbi:MAG: zinc-dependent metalloprotease [Pseudobacter sp.]|uniref:zinc-dependent metalloprotease n=1 Tax=Pseudobacter sp. TaxID=2045420 RepID=UPI003F7E47B5